MKNFVVSRISFQYNELTNKFVKARNIKDAWLIAYPSETYIVNGISGSNDLDTMKANAFDCDEMVDVVEIPVLIE